MNVNEWIWMNGNESKKGKWKNEWIKVNRWNWINEWHTDRQKCPGFDAQSAQGPLVLIWNYYIIFFAFNFSFIH